MLNNETYLDSQGYKNNIGLGSIIKSQAFTLPYKKRPDYIGGTPEPQPAL